jgi:hypothetical protein
MLDIAPVKAAVSWCHGAQWIQYGRDLDAEDLNSDADAAADEIDRMMSYDGSVNNQARGVSDVAGSYHVATWYLRR